MEETRITVGGTEIPLIWEVPAEAKGIVVFAHGSGSSRHSTRNNYVAVRLRAAGLGTVLFDLLVGAEVEDSGKRSDMDLHARRLCAVVDWMAQRDEGRDKAFGFYGTSTGGAVALLGSVACTGNIGAVVCRGGRADLALAILAKVPVPTLLIVGERDPQVLDINRRALSMLTCEKALTIVEGAGHLFEEPGKLDEVTELTRNWFLDRLNK